LFVLSKGSDSPLVVKEDRTAIASEDGKAVLYISESALPEGTSMEDIKVTTSSGHPILDDGVIKAIKKAAPFPSIPQNARLHITTTNNITVANIKMSFQYALEYTRLE